MVSTNLESTVSPPANADPPPPPVPPKTSSNVFPSSLGPISPSDWEYLGPTPGDVDDTEVFSPKRTPELPASTTNLPQSHPTETASPVSNPYIPTSQSVSPSIQVSHAENQIKLQNQSASSPVSSGSAQEIPHPPPSRVDTTESGYSLGSATDTTQKIDGAIKAWSRPFTSDAKQSAESSRQSSLSRSEERTIPRKPSPITTTPKPDSANQQKDAELSVNTAVSTNAPTILDPYEDLDPWFKSSLARYVAMLRKEAVADSDEERYKIFTAFTAKETKLREILYGIENEPKDDVVPQQPTPSPQQSADKADHSSPVESGLIPVESEQNDTTSAYYNEDFEEYSPGGRPMIPRPASVIQRPATQPPASRLTNDQSGASQIARSSSVPPIESNPPQPIYTPFRYMEGPQRGSDDLAIARPAYEAYNDLRQASAESGRVMSTAPNSDTGQGPNTRVSSPAQDEHGETFIGLIREKSVSYKKRAPRRTSSPPPLPMALRQGKRPNPVNELRSVVSAPSSKQSESPWHATTRTTLEQFSDDFAFIPQAVGTWEATAKIRRQELDAERIQRQEESEGHVDALFNGKEIGYADINVLEEEFRQTEARVQLDEERVELEKFIAEVFNPLDERLNQEISALRTHYDSALSQLDHESSKIKDSATDQSNLSHTMKAVSEIYRKLEMRYQKRMNLALDRERRRKKTERRPLVFMGDSAGLRRLDGDFDQMEKQNILEAAKDRDDRANRFMDSFDHAIMHGLGENQSLLDDMSTRVKNIDASSLNQPDMSDSEVEQILKSASTLVDSLRKDSESILHNFGIADSTLNNADYRLAVAEARYANAEHDVFRRLDAEKRKEDAKIQKELNSKLQSIREGPAEITRKINEFLGVLGKEPVPEPPTSSEVENVTGSHPVGILLPGPSPVPGPTPRPPTAASKKGEEDPEHQERIRRALENAKKRNAAKANSGASLS